MSNEQWARDKADAMSRSAEEQWARWEADPARNHHCYCGQGLALDTRKPRTANTIYLYCPNHRYDMPYPGYKPPPGQPERGRHQLQRLVFKCGHVGVRIVDDVTKDPTHFRQVSRLARVKTGISNIEDAKTVICDYCRQAATEKAAEARRLTPEQRQLTYGVSAMLRPTIPENIGLFQMRWVVKQVLDDIRAPSVWFKTEATNLPDAEVEWMTDAEKRSQKWDSRAYYLGPGMGGSTKGLIKYSHTYEPERRLSVLLHELGHHLQYYGYCQDGFTHKTLPTRATYRSEGIHRDAFRACVKLLVEAYNRVAERVAAGHLHFPTEAELGGDAYEAQRQQQRQQQKQSVDVLLQKLLAITPIVDAKWDLPTGEQVHEEPTDGSHIKVLDGYGRVVGQVHLVSSSDRNVSFHSYCDMRKDLWQVKVTREPVTCSACIAKLRGLLVRMPGGYPAWAKGKI